MTENVKNWFRERMGVFLLVVAILSAAGGAYMNYWLNYRALEKAIRIGAMVSDTDNQIYTIQRRP
jgi:predicted negative regulator of RcsB-dependent stress response